MFADIENLFYAVVGEITSTPPSTGAGVREYCHNWYNGCFSKVEVDDFRRFLGYALTDGTPLKLSEKDEKWEGIKAKVFKN